MVKVKEFKESDVYELIQKITPEYKYEDSFLDGDLGERIEEFPYYHEIKKFNLDSLDAEEWNLDEETIEDYMEKIKKEGVKNMPPLVIDDKNSIIDGTHRLNALLRTGYKEFKVLKGSKYSVLKNKKIPKI